MFDFLLVPVAIIYLIVVGLLFIYGVNFFYLTLVAWRKNKAVDKSQTIQLGPEDAAWPLVTIQLPIFNELYVVERMIEAAANMDYPRNRFEIQVLDDSTDETAEVAAEKVAQVQERGINIVHLHRKNRKGYKAGALSDGLQQARGEFIAIFDADFVPDSDFLKCALPHFDHSRVAFVQTRWGHLNRDYSILTMLQALSIDAHFMVEQFGRSRAGLWFNFNGTAGIWRRVAIDDAGGWKAETLTEDLDLSYRAYLKGWEARYVRDIEVKAELPVSFSAYRRQQHRWARGSIECSTRFLPLIWIAPISLAKKIGASLHLTGYYVHMLLFALILLYPLVLILAQRYDNLISLFGIAFVFNATAFAPTAFFTVAQQQIGRRWWSVIPLVLFMSVLGVGMMFNTLRAAFQAIFSSDYKFERTPKFGIAKKNQRWSGSRYRIKLDKLVFVELGFAVFNLLTVAYAIYLGNFVIAIYATVFSFGLLFASLSTILQSVGTIIKRAEPEYVLATIRKP